MKRLDLKNDPSWLGVVNKPCTSFHDLMDELIGGLFRLKDLETIDKFYDLLSDDEIEIVSELVSIESASFSLRRSVIEILLKYENELYGSNS